MFLLGGTLGAAVAVMVLVAVFASLVLDRPLLNGEIIAAGVIACAVGALWFVLMLRRLRSREEG